MCATTIDPKPRTLRHQLVHNLHHTSPRPVANETRRTDREPPKTVLPLAEAAAQVASASFIVTATISISIFCTSSLVSGGTPFRSPGPSAAPPAPGPTVVTADAPPAAPLFAAPPGPGSIVEPADVPPADTVDTLHVEEGPSNISCAHLLGRSGKYIGTLTVSKLRRLKERFLQAVGTQAKQTPHQQVLCTELWQDYRIRVSTFEDEVGLLLIRRQYVNHKGHRIHGLLEIQQGQFTFLPPNHWMTETHQQGKQCNWNLRIVIVANKAGWQKHCEDPDAAAECLKEALTSCLQSKVTTVEVTRQMRRAANVHDQGEDKPAQQSSPDYTIDTRPWQRYELPEVALQDMVNSHTTQMCTKCTAPQPLQWE
ncbi:hypothetical protein CYMTET_48498 [Cymbomonas tetramitiformis]|uniref:Uncharacterized protein n=1 Tax=Cymbomonas tetramitiformis TaxID=36881 RepID=A0AAE0EVI9_9CHLO|nr:hypothetical protein CYMTET_48498 [Cymbomonas tetramitiformis]